MLLSRGEDEELGEVTPTTARVHALLDTLRQHPEFPSRLEEVVAELAVVRMSLGLLDDSRDNLVLFVLHGEGATDMPDGYGLPKRTFGAWAAVHRDEAVFGGTDSSEGFLLEDILLSKEGIAQYVCLPLHRDGVVVGTLNIGTGAGGTMPPEAPEVAAKLVQILEEELASSA